MIKKMNLYLLLWVFVTMLFVLPHMTLAASGSGEFSMSEYNTLPNTDVTVTINAQSYDNVGGFDFTLEYDPDVITYESMTVGSLPELVLLDYDAATSTAGDMEQVLVDVLLMDAISGNGDLVTITFHTSSTSGTSTIEMVSMNVVDNDTFELTSATTPSPAQVNIALGYFEETDFQNSIPDSDITVQINAQGLNNVGGFDFTLEYDPDVITYESMTVGSLPELVLLDYDAATSTAGDMEQVLVDVLLMDAISGNGDLVTITFHTSSTSGTSTIEMVSMNVVDNDTFELSSFPVSSTDGLVTIEEPADTTAPVRSNLSPSGTLSSGTSQTTLSLTTDENAICHYATVVGTPYNDGIAFTTTGSTNHSTLVTGLSSGNSYNYYIRCEDSLGNKNTDDASIAFSVAVRTSSGGGGGGSSRDTSAPRGTSVVINNDETETTQRTVTLTLTATDSSDPITIQVSESDDFDDNSEWFAFDESVTFVLTSGNGEKTVYARFKDDEGNISDPVSDSITLTGSTATTLTSGLQTTQTTISNKPTGAVKTNSYRFTHELGIGMSGIAVIELQKRLRAEGFFTYPTNTGYFGPVTVTAVAKYQSYHGISNTGYVGPLTLKQLNSNVGSNASSPDEISLEAFVQLLLAVGIIPPEKAAIALEALRSFN